jgi:hypothetical protein
MIIILDDNLVNCFGLPYKFLKDGEIQYLNKIKEI